MKKVLAITVVAALMLCATAAMATETNWQLLLKATDLKGSNFNVNTSIGCQATFTDGNDGSTKGELTGPSSPGGGSTIATVAAVNGDVWGTRDFKAPITADVSSKIWTIKLYALTDGGPALDGLKLTVTPSTSVVPVYNILGQPYTYTFEGAFIPGGKVVYSASNPMPASFAFEAPFVLGANNAHTMTVTVAPVPEPSSFVALASGLFGLVGFGIRRRK